MRATIRNLWRGLKPPRRSLQQRLAMFPTDDLPLTRPAVIRWNDFQIPYVETETDRDLAFCLGMVHMHLRGTQIAMFRMLFAGRLSEIAGPLARDVDHLLRIVDYGRAAAEIEARMPPETHAWVSAFVEGLNHYQSRMSEPPPEFALLGLQTAPYTLRDIICGSRIGGTDFTWLMTASLLRHYGEPGFARLWNRLVQSGGGLPETGSEEDGSALAALEELLLTSGRADSNSIAVSPARSATGGALLANDPHLGLSLPSLWLLVGVRSPSFRLVGMMICGLPIFAIGRNSELAWGGTNMRAASSDLYDVSHLPDSTLETHETTIHVRGWRKAKRRLRRSPFGPVISDARMLHLKPERKIALRWVGHEPTEEFSCFLNAARAETPEQFRRAFAGYGVSAQNMLFADRQGNIGQVMAVTAPKRAPFPKNDPILAASDPNTHWQGFVDAMELPFILNPPEGLIVSANNRPKGTTVPIGFTFAPNDRKLRMQSLLQDRAAVSIDALKQIQVDTVSPDAARLAKALALMLRTLGDDDADEVARRIDAWDGDYRADSAGAVPFEILMCHLMLRLNGARRPERLPETMGQWSYLSTYLIADLDDLPPAERRTALRTAAAATLSDSRRYPSWGDMHRLRVAHLLARLPLVGRRFVFGEFPTGGSRQTPMKMAHGLVRRRHDTSFGSMARHISDLADPDGNWFAFLGGQDGWLGSDGVTDQLPLWRDHAYIRMPLSSEIVEREFPHVTRLTPLT